MRRTDRENGTVDIWLCSNFMDSWQVLKVWAAVEGETMGTCEGIDVWLKERREAMAGTVVPPVASRPGKGDAGPVA